MKIVVIGGTGLIGSNVVARLHKQGHEVVAASPRTGVDTLTGQGLDQALAGAQAVVDISNSPSYEASAVMAFFTESTRNLLAAEARAGVEHHLILSIVGADRLPDNAYLSAKATQEALLQASGQPYTILRATQFFEFIGGIVDAGTQDGVARLSPALFQPIAADDVAAVLADLAVGAPSNGILETGGPDRFPLDELARTYLTAQGDGRDVVADVHARYFGSELDDRSLVTGEGARIAPTRFHDWLSRAAAQA